LDKIPAIKAHREVDVQVPDYITPLENELTAHQEGQPVWFYVIRLPTSAEAQDRSTLLERKEPPAAPTKKATDLFAIFAPLGTGLAGHLLHRIMGPLLSPPDSPSDADRPAPYFAEARGKNLSIEQTAEYLGVSIRTVY